MAVVRPTVRVSVRVPGSQSGLMVGLDPAQEYDPADPLVKAYPWAFASDKPESRSNRGVRVESVPVERATRAPGEKRR